MVVAACAVAAPTAHAGLCDLLHTCGSPVAPPVPMQPLPAPVPGQPLFDRVDGHLQLGLTERGYDGSPNGLGRAATANQEAAFVRGIDGTLLRVPVSWAQAEPDYDLTVVPFFDRVIGNSYAALHPPGGYYETNAYPVKSVKAAGATLVAGSDAPVNTRDPQPFVNMAIAVTRRLPGQQPLNASQAISIQEVLDAYTINGARFLSRDTETGSLETGKSADFIVVDQDVLKLAAANRAADIAKTRVLETWFMGRKVYVAAAHGGA